MRQDTQKERKEEEREIIIFNKKMMVGDNSARKKTQLGPIPKQSSKCVSQKARVSRANQASSRENWCFLQQQLGT